MKRKKEKIFENSLQPQSDTVHISLIVQINAIVKKNKKLFNSMLTFSLFSVH